MTVSIAHKPIQGRGGLSDLGALTLAFIDGGVEWLNWAVGDHTAGYPFADETSLIRNVQYGLHASPVTWLPRLDLLVSPVKLLTFSLSDLRTVAKVEGGSDDPVTLQQVQAILRAHDVLTRADLAAVAPFLAALGVAGSPLFQSLGLDDLAALWQLITLPQPQDGDPDITADAAAFAVAQARTPQEFADYYRVYLAQVGRMKAAAASAEDRLQIATTAVQTLLPLMFGALDCPQVGDMVSPAEVATVVAEWLRQGRRVGFSRLSEGVYRVIDSTTFTTEQGAAARQVVNQYLANAQSFLAAHPAQTGRMSQDGRSCTLPIETGSLYAELLLGPSGGVTLQQFRRQRPAPSN